MSALSMHLFSVLVLLLLYTIDLCMAGTSLVTKLRPDFGGMSRTGKQEFVTQQIEVASLFGCVRSIDALHARICGCKIKQNVVNEPASRLTVR
jgi:hypothetical protein